MAEINPTSSSLANMAGAHQANAGKATERIASGVRINRASDDAAGLAVSEKLRSQFSGLRQAERNTMNVMSFTQTAEGHLGGVTSAIQRVRELSVQAANGIYTTEDRQIMQNEANQLLDQIDRVGSDAQFNQQRIFTGDFARTNQPLRAQVGANMHQAEEVPVEEMNSGALGLQRVDLMSAESANQSIAIADEALAQVSSQRASLGASQNRFEHAAQGLATAYENTVASESRIRDANIAEEMTRLTGSDVQLKSAIAMQAHKNLNSQVALQLLQ